MKELHITQGIRMDLKHFISDSGIFDINYYLNENQDVKSSGMGAIEHYCEFGFKEGRNPNALFHSKWYAMQYGLDYDTNPLLHYLVDGWKAGYSPSYKFDVKKFQNKHGLEQGVDGEPLSIYLSSPESFAPLELYRMDYDNEDVKAIIESKLFSEDWYLKRNQDLSYQDPILHYVAFGFLESNRVPNPFFDGVWYRNLYLDGSEVNSLTHYIRKGWKLGFSPSSKFCVNSYLENYKDVKTSGIEPLNHFLTYGRNNGYSAFKHEIKNTVPVDKTSSIASQVFPDLDFVNDYKWRELEPTSTTFDAKRLDIHFIIPDFAAGGGGHMNIFRMLWHLEFLGHDITIWIFRPTLHNTPQDAYEDIVRHYNTLRAKVLFVDESFPEATGDVIFASSWDTVWPLGAATNFKRRFYFIQDYESSFYAKGSRSVLAESTYNKELDCICASTWLEEVMTTKHNRWARSFNLTADPSIFYPRQIENTKNKKVRIVFYARMHTSRRAVELGFLALELLAKDGLDFHVDCYGVDYQINASPFSCTVYKTRTPEELAKMYNESDIGLVFSLTNYSLVPQEMMACGLPVVEFSGESTRAIYPEDVVTFSGPSPYDIKAKILELVKDEGRRRAQSEKASEWVAQYSWRGEAEKVSSSIVNRLIECGFSNRSITQDCDLIMATVVIPTYNPGEIFKRVFDKILDQRTPWKYEIIVLDSETSDGSIDFIKSVPNVILKTIKKAEFNHGDTRNYGVELARGEFVAFITHDAIPANEYWLYNLIVSLQHYPSAAGAFGRHIAHDDATFFTKREMDMHFQGFEKFPFVVSKLTEIPTDLTQEQWEGILRFYSDNNSCLRKSVWEKIPYRRVQYGEDQIWGNDVINEGYQKVYVPTAIVKHSHDYEPEDLYERSKIDGDYFKYFFDVTLIEEKDVEATVEQLNSHDKVIGFEEGLSDEEIEYRMQCNLAKLKGYAEGANKKISMFDNSSNEKSKF